jgi:hypothetical protein
MHQGVRQYNFYAVSTQLIPGLTKKNIPWASTPEKRVGLMGKRKYVSLVVVRGDFGSYYREPFGG